MRIEVESEATSGSGILTPLRLRLGRRSLHVVEVVDRWYGDRRSYFRVRTEDDQLYVLAHDEATRSWELAAYTRDARGEVRGLDPGASGSLGSQVRH